MDCILSTAIALPCRGSKGGVQLVYVAEFDAVVRPLSIVSGVATLTMEATKKFFTYSLRQGAGEAMSTIGGERAIGGRFYTHSVAFRLEKFEVVKRNELSALAAARVVIIVVDENDKAFVYGLERGLEVSEGTAQTGTASADQNGFAFTLTSEEPAQPYSIDPTTIAGLIA